MVPRIAAFLVGLSTLVVFLPALDNGFVNWDDQTYVATNTDFRGFGWSQIQWMWTNRLQSHYVPLTWMSFGLDYVIWKEKGLGYHLTNVLLHATNAALFFLLALAVFKLAFARQELRTAQVEGELVLGAVFAALFFSLHPLRVESVAWVTERRDVLSGTFYLLALLVYVRAFPKDSHWSMPRKSYLLCLALFAMSILSKEVAVTLPACLLLLDVYPLRRLGGSYGWTGDEARKVWLEKIPFFLIGLADSAVTLYFGIRDNLVQSVHALGWMARIAITVYGMAFYLLKTVLPTALSPLYPLTRAKTSFSGMPFQLSAVCVLLVTLTCIALRRRFPGLLAAWTACAITLLPMSGIFHHGFQIAADRYTYLACLGYALLAGSVVALGWRESIHSVPRRILLSSGALTVLLTLSFLTRNQISVWHDSDSLWRRAITVEPSVVAHLNLGSSLDGEGDTMGAIEHFRKAIALWPDSAAAHSNLGKALLKERDWGEAAQEFRRVVELEPNPDAFNSLAHALVMQGNLDEAIGALSEALRSNPADATARANMQALLEMKTRQKQR